MKLNLDISKFETTELPVEAHAKIKGGGWARSQRLDGNCNYSRNHPAHDCDGDVAGCAIATEQ
jgi:hypothetical protein